MAPSGSSTELLARRHPVLETLRSGRRDIHRLWVESGKQDQEIRVIVKTAEASHVPMTVTDRRELDRLAARNDVSGKHQGVLLETGPYVYSEPDDMLQAARQQGEMPLLLLLDLLHGPQNIGSLLRTAEAVGVHGVILQDRRAPDITPSVVQYSVGSSEHLRIARVTNLVQTMRLLKEQNVWMAGLDLDDVASPLPEVDLNIPLGVVVGHEGQGLRRLVRQTCDIRVYLPMRGKVESLNAAVAGSVLLYAAWQARGFSP